MKILFTKSAVRKVSGFLLAIIFSAVPLLLSAQTQDENSSQAQSTGTKTIDPNLIIKDSIRIPDMISVYPVVHFNDGENTGVETKMKKSKSRIDFGVKGKTNLFLACEVYVELPAEIMKEWEKGGKKGANIKQVDNRLQLLTNGAYIENISRKEPSPISMTFYVKMKKSAKKTRGTFTISYKETTIVKGKPVELNKGSKDCPMVIH
jgi:hypothetical protein